MRRFMSTTNHWRDPAFQDRFMTVALAFEPDQLKRICEMSEADFAAAYDMETVKVRQTAPDDFYYFKDNGANILAVAHLDTVGLADERGCQIINTEGGPVVFSRALDDRLGAYIILELLPKLGLQFDILLTVGEEQGKSTAAFFEPPADKNYHWMIEFDRGGTDVVMYQYEDQATEDLVYDCGAQVGMGSYSDISYLDHLEIKGFNWGVGYEDYHGPRAHAFLNDTFMMVGHFLKFHEVNADVYLPHEEEDEWFRRGGRYFDDDSLASDDLIDIAIAKYRQIDDDDDAKGCCEGVDSEGFDKDGFFVGVPEHSESKEVALWSQ